MNPLSKFKLSKSQVLSLFAVNAGLLNIYAKDSGWMPFILVCSVFGTLLLAGLVSIALRKDEKNR